jgi:hypothetical protein
MVDRTKDAITTNNTKPVGPERPGVRRPAAGPLITTTNVEAIRRRNAETAKAEKKGKAKE